VADSSSGLVYAYDHVGREIYRRSSPDPWVRWLEVGPFDSDHDSDGHGDFLVSLATTLTSAGGAEIVSGRTGLPIFRVFGTQPGDLLGFGLTGCGDLDGDGRQDILLGGGSHAPGSMQAFSSATGQRLWAWYSGYYWDNFGAIMLGSVDIDQDGIIDPMATSLDNPVSPGSNVRGYLTILSGRDGAELLRFSDWSGTTYASTFGYLVAVGPRPGSTLPRFLTTATSWARVPATGEYISRWYMFEGGPAGASTAGLGCAGSLNNEPRIGLRQMAAGHGRITLSSADPGMLSLLVLGTSTAQPLSLAPFGFRGCTLYPSIQEVGIVIPGTVGLNAGYGYHDFGRGFAASSGTTGMTVVGQFVVLGSGAHWPGGVTAALRWNFQ
jgi:hypothetical protein